MAQTLNVDASTHGKAAEPLTYVLDLEHLETSSCVAALRCVSNQSQVAVNFSLACTQWHAHSGHCGSWSVPCSPSIRQC